MILTTFIANLTAEPGLAPTVISFSRLKFNYIRRAKARALKRRVGSFASLDATQRSKPSRSLRPVRLSSGSGQASHAAHGRLGCRHIMANKKAKRVVSGEQLAKATAEKVFAWEKCGGMLRPVPAISSPCFCQRGLFLPQFSQQRHLP